MDRDIIFRLALVTHSNAPTTVKRYICLLSKLVIVKSNLTKFSPNKISSQIKTDYELEFSKKEINDALQSDDDFKYDEKERFYRLKPSGIQSLKEIEGNNHNLEFFVTEFLSNYQNIPENEFQKIRETVNRYIYHVFNSGKQSLLTLLSGDITKPVLSDFYANEKEKKIINDFIEWENPEKNECIYSIVSYSIDYGMLTCKKDAEAYKDTFKDINFYLDSNIILRLIGMNNVERQEITQHFIRKCNEVNIKVCYTNFTYSEIYFVVDKAVKYINTLSNGDEPIPPSELDRLGEYDNKDFYEMYYNWCKIDGNRYDDYDSYRDFLKNKVRDCLSEFIREDVTSAEFTENSSEFSKLSKSLMDYKNKRNPDRHCSIDSAKNDVENYLFIKKMNVLNKEGIDTKNFIITADHRFYDWLSMVFPGAPICFYPSEWLSIILKFTSRTDSDYNAFCKFINLRLLHNDKIKQKNFHIIQSINEHTSDVELKKKVIRCIEEMHIDNKIGTKSSEKEVVEKAFDKILQAKENELEGEFKRELDDLNTKNDKVQKGIEEETFKKAAQKIADKKNSFWKTVNDHIVISEAITVVLSLVILFLIAYNNNISTLIGDICKNHTIFNGKDFEVASAVSAVAAAIIAIILYILVAYKCSEKRTKRIVNKIYKSLGE